MSAPAPTAAPSAQPQPQPAGAPQRPWSASISAKLVRSTGIDTYEEITYSDGVFTRRFGVFGRPNPRVVEVLDPAAREQLLAELEQELDNLPAGVDSKALSDVADLLRDSLAQATARFAHARFGSVVHDPPGHLYLGFLSLGVDVIGTVRDDNGALTYEQHVVTQAAGPFVILSAEDQQSLADALTTYLTTPGANEAWNPIRDDARTGGQQ